eukprot:170267-Amphidinium_carterae.3
MVYGLHLTNTTLLTYHTAIGADTVYKVRADSNTIKKVDYETKHHTDRLGVPQERQRQEEIYTLLMMCESTTGLGHATMVPYKAITRFIVENGLQTTILQSDGDPAILEPLIQELELLSEMGRRLPHIKIQTSPQHSHQSQGIVERYHQTLFAQLRTIIFQFCHNYDLDPQQISSHSPLINHLLHHTTWLLNRYLRHSDSKTSYERNWK